MKSSKTNLDGLATLKDNQRVIRNFTGLKLDADSGLQEAREG